MNVPTRYHVDVTMVRIRMPQLVAVILACGIASAFAQANDGSNTNSVTLPFTISRGHVVVRAALNGTPVSAMVDTGYEMTMVHPDLAEKLGLSKGGRMTIVGIAGEETADVFSGAVFSFEGFTYSPRRVAAIRAERGRRGWEGILGAGLFRRFVVEFRPEQKTLTLREPRSFDHAGNGTILPLQFRRRSATPIVDAEIVVGRGRTVAGRFELDTGCAGGLCLGRDFAETNRLLQASAGTRPGGRRGVGGGVDSVEGVLPEVRLGGLSVSKPEVNFFSEGSPVDGGLAGHIGWEVLRRFDVVILDYERRRMILVK